jgi:very-short-patch-repair endonuclease
MHHAVPLWRGRRGRIKSKLFNKLVSSMEPIDQKNLYYNKKLRNFASTNRKDMTKAEACLWKYVLGGRKMLGYQFRRQRPVLNFIADFMCKELMLIIEVDGLTHQWEEVYKKDLLRQKQLEEIGFTVLRFDDEEVLKNIENVYDYLTDFIKDNLIENPPPLIPPPAGDT